MAEGQVGRQAGRWASHLCVRHILRPLEVGLEERCLVEDVPALGGSVLLGLLILGLRLLNRLQPVCVCGGGGPGGQHEAQADR